jgi:hypothetical protein
MKRYNVQPLSRRSYLRCGAVVLGLPLLDAMLPIGLRAEQKAAPMRPQRLLLIGRVLGTNAEYFFPQQVGLDYEATRYLKLLDEHRGRFTVVSGMSHRDYPNSHHTESGLFTGMTPERIQRADDIRATISLDQVVAEKVGSQTRFSSVLMGRTNQPMTYSRSGVPVPTEEKPEAIFRRLFMDGSPEEIAKETQRLRDGQSILDGLRGQLKSLGRGVGSGDRARLELLATSIRDAERELLQASAWVTKPKPTVDRRVEDFQGADWASGQKMRYDLAFLAFQTDSTRVAVALEGEAGPGAAPGTQIGQHDASHHGQSPEKIEQFARYEEEQLRHIAGLLDKLHGASDGDETLLDRTTVIWCSNIGNPSAHASNNLPVFVAGGGLKHQGHLAFDRDSNKPLSNLYLRVLRQFGIEDETFGSSSGELGELG